MATVLGPEPVVPGTVPGIGARVESPSAERNKEPILAVLQQYLKASQTGQVLELASGTGQHVAHIAPAFAGLIFQPSDRTPELFDSISDWAAGLSNVRLPPVVLDATDAEWPVPALGSLEAVLVINMTHISPWEATLGLVAGAGRYLVPGRGRLFIYGPFKRDGKHTSESNEAFDVNLKGRNPAWGYRDIGDVTQAAAPHGLELVAVHDMPAHNFMLVYSKKL